MLTRAERRSKYMASKRAWLKELKAGLACVRCGYSRSAAALDFHHPNGDKEQGVTRMLKDSSKQRILEEIAKCEVLCSNCHREEHFG